MKLQGYGEDRLIAELTRGLPEGAEVRVGVGDDCAVLGRPRDVRWQLLKTDAVVEGVHFLPSDDGKRVGWKALCRAVSDIAGMGGTPEHAVITLAVSPEMELARIKAVYAGLKRAARRFGVSIVGGETSRSPGPLLVNVALTGWVARERCVLRSGGKPGDHLYVTGRLGGSRAGKHLDFIPRLPEAQWLAANFLPHAMMDLSDGLASDLPRLGKSSRCGFVLEEARVPISRGCTLAQALTDGEDFELLFALAPRAGAKLELAWPKQFPKLPLTRIGALTLPTKRKPGSSGKTAHGFDHFAGR
ncbi:MAG TPA: thiamine-phosphate kinase [Chthoniobacteraceae bacterium]|jgi:thiamine-monophosphate kinase